MKITVSQLRRIIKEELTRVLEEGEAYRVTFTSKDGKTQSVTFPKKALADMYAKNYKDAVVQPVDADVKDVEVKKMPAAGLDDLRASAKSFYKSAKAGEKFNPRGKSTDLGADSEHAAEQEAEFWAASKAAGQSTADAYRDLDYENKHAAFRKKLGMR